MAITLHVIAGPQTGAALPLNSELSVGSDPGNDLVLAGCQVASRHCRIRPEGVGGVLTGLAPTFVNGLPVVQHALAPGDTIHLGDAVIVLRESDLAAGAAWLDSSSLSIHRAVSAEVVLGVLEPSREWPAAGGGPGPRALAQIATVLASVDGLAGLGRPLLELILDALAADRGAVLLEAAHGGIDVLCALDRSAPGARVGLSRAAVDRVLREGIALVASRTAPPPVPPPATVLVTPLRAFARVLGVLYIEAAHVRAGDANEHLRFLTAVSGTAALAIAHARHLEQVEEEAREQRAAVDRGHNMIGDSPSMRRMYRDIARAAPADSTVLICGESGTGKELVARAVHRNSRRADKPFVPINCAAIPDTLLESELFGHEKGAFTGALAQKKGRLEAADGGTVFLDEIGELPMALQAKLLRALQEREIERVGGTRTVKLDIRLVAATNQDLKGAVRAGRFRQDLYFRLDVIALQVPPLRERGDDVVLLASHFAVKHARRAGRRAVSIACDAFAALRAYDWPGNVRELENAIERAVVLGEDDVVHLHDLPETLAELASAVDAGGAERFHAAVRQRKKELILRAVDRAGGNLAAAARTLGLHPNYLHRLIRTLQLRGLLKVRAANVEGSARPPNQVG